MAGFDVAALIEEAYRRLGLDPQTLSAGHLQSAATSLDLILRDTDLAKLTGWALANFATATVSSIAVLSMPADTVDVVAPLMILQDTAPIALTRVPYWEWQELAAATGAPTHYRVIRTASPVVVQFWPTPDAAYTITGARLRQLQGVVNLTAGADLPARWTNALIAELAFALYQKLPGETRSPVIREDLMTELVRQRQAIATDNAEPGAWRY